MPDYDLGTAHGRIKIDYDDSGAKKAKASTSDIERSMEKLDRRMGQIQRTMSSLEREIKNLAQEMRNAAGETEDFEQEVDSLHRGLGRLHGSAGVSIQDMARLAQQMDRAARAARTIIPPMTTLYQVTRKFQDSKGGFLGFLGALRGTGIAGLGIGLLTNRFLGLNKAMKDVPKWQQSILKLGGALSSLATIGAFASFLQRHTTGSDLFARSLRNVSRHSKTATSAMKSLAAANDAVLNKLRGTGNSFNGLAKGIYESVSGMAIMKLALNNLTSRFGKLGHFAKIALLSIAAIGAIGPASLELLNKALIATSNLVAGLWNGIKQLSGGLLAYPGIISMVITSFSTLGVIFKGLGDKFKDLGKGGEDALVALLSLPPHLQKMGRAIYNLMPRLRDFQTAIQTAFDFDKAADQLDQLANTYLPKLQIGMTSLASTFKSGRARLVEFFQEAQTIKDTEKIFSLTTQTAQNFNYALKPLARGLKDISIAGAEVITKLSAGLPSLVERFSEWARINRENGNIARWIEDSWIGVKNLTKGMIDLIQATYKLLTLFATNDGSNFLERFAKAMERFNKTVSESAATGALKKIGDAVRNMGTEHIETLKDVFRSFLDAAKEAWPVIKQFSSSISDVMVPAIKASLQILELLFAALNDSPFVTVAGYIGGIAAAFLAMKFVLGPIINIVQLVAGAFKLFKGAQAIVLGLAGGLEHLGSVGKKASTSLLSVGDSIASWASKAGLAGIAVATLVGGILGAKQNVDEFNQVLTQGERNFNDWKDGLKHAFEADHGMVGNTVMDQITTGVVDMRNQLQTEADKVPGVMEHLQELWFGAGKNFGAGMGPFSFAEGDAFNQNQKIAQDAEQAQKAFDRLGYSTEDLTKIVAGSDPYFQAMINHIKKSGDGGNEAAAQLQKLRDEFKQLQAAGEALGPGKMQVVEGLKQISNAAGDVDKKLNGLRNVLEGLGLIQTSALQASAEYAQSIRDLGENIRDAVQSGGGLTNLINQQTGAIDVTTQTGKNLLDVLAPIGEQYLRLVAKGEDATKTFKDFSDQLHQAAQATGVDEEALKNLAKQIGLVNPQELSQKLQELLNGPDKELLVKLGITPDTIKKIEEQLQSSGIKITPTIEPNKDERTQDPQKNSRTAEVEAAISDAEKKLKEFTDGTQSEIDKAAQEAYTSGGKFAREFGRGMSENLGAVQGAAGLLAGTALGFFHQSPPKEGPLAAHGDAIKYAGGVFSESYAEGITSKTGEVRGASSYVAGQALEGASGFSGARSVGRYLGQLFDFAEIAQRVTDIFSKVSSTVLQAFKFISDPFDKGTFFGKPLGFSKTVSDETLAAQRAQQNQQSLFSIAGGGQRNLDAWNRQGQLVKGAPKDDVVAAIVAEGQRRGLHQEQIVAAIATAGHESAYGQNNIGENQGAFLPGGGKGTAYGIFQQTPEGGWGSPEQLLDPNFAINAFYDKYQQNLAAGLSPLNAAVYTQNPQLGTNAAGTKYGSITGNFINEARGLYGQAIVRPPSYAAPGSNPIIGGVGGPVRPSILHDQAGHPSQVAPTAVAGILSRYFPSLVDIGGGRQDNLPYHTEGRALDVMIPNPNTPEGKALGYEIQKFIQDNAVGFGVTDTIFDGKYSATGQATIPYSGDNPHTDHVHITFAPGAQFNPAGGNNRQQRKIPKFLDPYSGGDTNQTVVRRNPDGTYTPVTKHGENAGAAPGDINEVTGKPYTEEEKQAIINANPLEFTLPDNMTFEQFQALRQDPNYFFGTQEEFQAQLGSQSPAVAAAYAAQANGFQNLSSTEIQQHLQGLDAEILRNQEINTPQSLAAAAELQGLQSELMSQTGYTRNQNPIDAISGLVSGASGVASSVIASVTSGLESIAATKNITGTLVRGVANTEDLYNIVDNVQKYLEFAANIAGSVANISGLVGSIVGATAGADPSGGASGAATAIAAVSAIASGVQAGIETVNAIIDLGQMIYRIAGTYIGDFLGYLVGGPGGQLTGNVKFLLDQQTNQLLAYSADNPLDKRSHNLPFADQSAADSRSQLVGNINVYGGPGSDPRDLTRDMMFQINSAQYAGALAS